LDQGSEEQHPPQTPTPIDCWPIFHTEIGNNNIWGIAMCNLSMILYTWHLPVWSFYKFLQGPLWPTTHHKFVILHATPMCIQMDHQEIRLTAWLIWKRWQKISHLFPISNRPKTKSVNSRTELLNLCLEAENLLGLPTLTTLQAN